MMKNYKKRMQVQKIYLGLFSKQPVFVGFSLYISTVSPLPSARRWWEVFDFHVKIFQMRVDSKQAGVLGGSSNYFLLIFPPPSHSLRGSETWSSVTELQWTGCYHKYVEEAVTLAKKTWRFLQNSIWNPLGTFDVIPVGCTTSLKVLHLHINETTITTTINLPHRRRQDYLHVAKRILWAFVASSRTVSWEYQE